MSETPAARVLPGLALATLGAIAFSGKAILAKLAYRHGVDAVQVIFWRMLLALPLFLALAWWAGRGKPPFSARDWRTVAGLGFCGYYLASLLDFMGLQYISAGLERLILYLNPTLVLLLSVVLLGKRAVGAAGGGDGAELCRRGGGLRPGTAAGGHACRARRRAGLRQRGELCGLPGLQRARGCNASVPCA